MGFFGEEITNQKVELEVPEGYNLKLLQACLSPSCKDTAIVTTLYVQTVNEEKAFVLCSLGGSKQQPVRFCSLQHDFGPEDSPLQLHTTGEKIHLTGAWKWDKDAFGGEEDEDDSSSCTEEGGHEGCDHDGDEIEVEKLSKPKPIKRSQDIEEDTNKTDEVVPEKKTKRNKRGGNMETIVPASELVVVSKPPSLDEDRKVWKIKPQNGEGIVVPVPKQKTLKTGVLITDYVVGGGAEPKLGSAVKITYEGMYPNGHVFDKNGSRKKPLKFRIGAGEVIRGLDLGMDNMRVGGSREVVIPPALGYGKEGIGEIPGNQVLIFRITLIGIDKKMLSSKKR